MRTTPNIEVEVPYSVERADQEIILRVRGTVSPIIRGRFSGPPEDCYPDEGGECEIIEILAPVPGTWSMLSPPKWDGELTEKETEAVEAVLVEAAEELMNARMEAAMGDGGEE
jgi:hypothetical protein